MKKITLSALLLLTTILSACGSSSKETPPIDNTPKAVIPPTIPAEKVANLESYLWAFDAESPIKSTAALSKTHVFFGTDKGIVYALNIGDGTKSWQRNIGSKVSGNILYAENTVLFLSLNGIFHALNAETGDTLWSIATATESLLDVWDYHTNSPIYQNNRIYLASKSGTVYALNITDGAVIWSYNLNEKLRGTPLIMDNNLYISSETGVFSINTLNGSENWHKAKNMPSSPAIESGILTVGTRAGIIAGYDAITGDNVWSLSHGTNWVTGDALAYNGAFYIGSSDDFKFESIDATTGQLNWSVNSGKNVFSKAVIANDIIYITSGDAYSAPGTGYIKSYDLTGKKLWSLKGSNFFSSPVINDNAIFLGSDDGYFYSVALTQE